MRPFIFFIFVLFSSLTFAQVYHEGSMSEMGKTNFQPVVSIDSLLDVSGLFGLGPYAYMQGELTVVDGKPLVGMRGPSGNMQVQNITKATAPFFVYTYVNEWKTSQHNIQISHPSDIQAWIESNAGALELDLSKPFPFRIEAEIDSLMVHVVMPRSGDVAGYVEGQKSQKYTYQAISGALVGFYSQNGRGIYTHKDSNIHVHFISEDGQVVGHVDQLQMKSKSIRLLIPSNNK